MIDIDNWMRELEEEEDIEIKNNEEYQTKLFEEYVLRGSDHQEERRKLNERYLSGEELMGEHGLRKELAAFDMSYFGRAYLPHYFIRKSPHFHEELDEIWSRGVMKGRNPLKEAKVISRLKGSRQVVAAPRGHAKSTNFTFKDSLHAILYAYKHYILILSDSSEQAEGFLDDIKTELEDNANIIMDFGSLKGDKAWRTGVILTKTDIKAEAIGSGKKVRGRRHRNWRPDLIVLDDIENDENVNTPEQRRKLKNWFDKAVSKAGDTYTDIMYIGTISIMELAWTVEDGRNVIEDIEYVHPKKLVWDSTTDELKVCTREYPSGVELPENKFVVHKYKAKSGHASRAGIMRVVSWMYLFKNYDIKDWVSFCEVFGMPLRLGKYDASASESDKKQLMEAIISLGTDAAGIVPSSTMIEFIESQKTTSVEIYEKLARYCDEQISKAILGQTLTSDSGGGSYAQSKTHNEVRHDLTVADAKSLAVTIRRDIIRPLVEFNYGSEANIPFFGFDCHEVEDQKEVVEIYKTLACDMGLGIPKSHIYKKFNIPKPENGEEVLKPPQAGMMTAQQQPMETTEELKLKQEEGQAEQRQVDTIVSIANKQSEDIFREMMKPIFKMIDKAEDMDELQKVLKDEKKLRELYQDMESPELEDLIQQGIYLSHLIGRSMD